MEEARHLTKSSMIKWDSIDEESGEDRGVFGVVHETVFDSLPDYFNQAAQIAYLLPGAGSDEEENRLARDFIRFWNVEKALPVSSYSDGVLPSERPYSQFAEYKSTTVSSDIPEAALAMQLHDTPQLPATNGRTVQWIPFRVFSDLHGMLRIFPGSIVTQAERNVQHSPNVINIIGSINENGSMSLRSGVFETEGKANQLMGVIKAMYEAREEKTGIPIGNVRVLSQQLNSPGLFGFGEGGLIEGQSAQSHLIERLIDPWLKRKKAPDVAYFNTSVNQFNVLPGQSSHKLNTVGAAVLVEWMCQDLFQDKSPDFLLKKEGHGHMRVSLQRVLAARDKNDVETANKHTQILKGRLKKVGKKLSEYANQPLAENTEQVRMQTIAACIMGHIAAQQTDSTKKAKVRKLDAAEEVGLHFLAGRLVDALIMKNCYSGVDRTGFIAAMNYAIDLKLEEQIKQRADRADAFKAVYEFMMTFGDRVTAMDKEVLKGKSVDYANWLAKNRETYGDVLQFQNWMWEYIMSVSQPLEWSSSGVWGLKWKGLFVNQHPIPYLPRYVFDQESQNWICLLKQSSRKGYKFTQEGENIFLAHASKRNG